MAKLSSLSGGVSKARGIQMVIYLIPPNARSEEDCRILTITQRDGTPCGLDVMLESKRGYRLVKAEQVDRAGGLAKYLARR